MSCSVCKHGWRTTPINWGKSGYMRALCEKHQEQIREANRAASGQ